MRPFVIAGCGRSGTMGMAQLLNALGIRTSFEEFFSATRDPPERGFAVWLARTGTMGEVSGMAAPFLFGRESETAILHQVRNPMGVIASIMGLKTWTEKAGWPNVKFNRRWLPGINDADDPLTKSMKYWLLWNQLVEDAEPVKQYRAESICPHLLVEIFDCIGLSQTVANIQPCFTGVYNWTNNTGPHEAISWRHIPETPLKERVRQKAIQYGYTEQDLYGFCPVSCGKPYPCEHLSAGIVGAS